MAATTTLKRLLEEAEDEVERSRKRARREPPPEDEQAALIVPLEVIELVAAAGCDRWLARVMSMTSRLLLRRLDPVAKRLALTDCPDLTPHELLLYWRTRYSASDAPPSLALLEVIARSGRYATNLGMIMDVARLHANHTGATTQSAEGSPDFKLLATALAYARASCGADDSDIIARTLAVVQRKAVADGSVQGPLIAGLVINTGDGRAVAQAAAAMPGLRYHLINALDCYESMCLHQFIGRHDLSAASKIAVLDALTALSTSTPRGIRFYENDLVIAMVDMAPPGQLLPLAHWLGRHVSCRHLAGTLVRAIELLASKAGARFWTDATCYADHVALLALRMHMDADQVPYLNVRYGSLSLTDMASTGFFAYCTVDRPWFVADPIFSLRKPADVELLDRLVREGRLIYDAEAWGQSIDTDILDFLSDRAHLRADTVADAEQGVSEWIRQHRYYTTASRR